MGERLALLADASLGRLARWLRLLGYDTAYDNRATGLQPARRARAEDRVLLTRSRELAARRGLRTLLIRAEELEEQLRQVRQEVGPPPAPVLSRCSLCNLVLEEVTPQEVADLVPPYVLRTQERFKRCPGCGRVYWAGTHVEQMRRFWQ